jgi:hypothetical protein
MGAGELAHQRWVHAQLDPAQRPAVVAWPWTVKEDIGGVPVAFLHNALDETGRGFAEVICNPDPATIDRLFATRRARLVFYGHLHCPSPVAPEVVLRAQYVNPGALSCSPEPLARFALVDLDREGPSRVAFQAVPYEPAPLFDAIKEWQVPNRAFITATFFAGRGPTFADAPWSAALTSLDVRVHSA